ncbi:MAG: aspartate carbamoyltransferase catalytic subunit [Chloroflexota bacterium]|nr:aspartate carbamoyltransferase catalytic subunit [Chloroflexota bacterium]
MSLSRKIDTPETVGGLGQESVPRLHVLDLDDFSREEISEVLNSARGMKEVLGRDIKKVPALRGKVIVTLFYEASTRTRISFEEAGKVLSADVINMSASGSSAEKGESLLNTGLTIQAMGVDTIVIRHPHSGAAHLLAQHLDKVSIINAGDGLHAHPTQALLDLYTVQDKFESLEGLKVVIVGDVLHSRVARSDIWGFAKMGAKVVLSGPPTLMPPDLIRSSKSMARSPFASLVEVETDLDKAIEGADVVMALRLQKERQHGGFLPSMREYIRRWQVTDTRLGLAAPSAMVMHPGPMNEGIEISNSVAHGGRSMIEEQVTNGVAVRMALLYELTIGPGQEL